MLRYVKLACQDLDRPLGREDSLIVEYFDNTEACRFFQRKHFDSDYCKAGGYVKKIDLLIQNMRSIM